MKLIREGDDYRKHFVGTRHQCSLCDAVFEVETPDDIMEIRRNQLGNPFWADVMCPSCEREVVITRAPRMITDMDICRPLFGDTHE